MKVSINDKTIEFEKGDRFQLLKPIDSLDESLVGKMFEVFGETIGFKCNPFNIRVLLRMSNHILMDVSLEELGEYFEKYDVEKYQESKSVSKNKIDDLLKRSEVQVSTVFDKCTVVSVKLPNGFVIVESSSCVDPKNYNKELGEKICMKKLKDKIFELEGYLLQNDIYEQNLWS